MVTRVWERRKGGDMIKGYRPSVLKQAIDIKCKPWRL